MQLITDVKVVRVMNDVAAGTSNQNSTHIDTQDQEGVTFIAMLGALTATQVTGMKIQGGALADDSDMADLSPALAVGPMADGDSNKMLMIDVRKIQHRYVRAVVTRGTANAVIDGVVALVYGPRRMPVAIDATTSKSSSANEPS